MHEEANTEKVEQYIYRYVCLVVFFILFYFLALVCLLFCCSFPLSSIGLDYKLTWKAKQTAKSRIFRC